MTRILTYNVHRCVGADRVLDVARVAEAIAMQAPDIVALQELDVGRARTGGVDQAHELARRLGMTCHFNATLKVEEELYGDAILTSLPERLVRAGPLPGHPRLARLEPRGALWVAIDVGGVELQVINTHLGLVPYEQRLQAEALAGPGWLMAAPRDKPLILLGDFNATPLTRVYGALAAKLADARRMARGCGRRPTFPARMPMLAIDHVFVSDGVRVEAVRTPLDPASRVASDHLPLVVDFTLAA
ncbi:MAG TPA: endonuclease/exonuclease/phosphatase family protein [Caulobacteraceae bacterium]|nr:endonuclease/exonuclease/phosphatase family protein [Caulobacteraceae bacterium]